MTTDLTTTYTICGYKDVLGELDRRRHDLVISIEHPGATPDFGLSPDIAAHGHDVPQHKLIFWDNDVADLPDMCTADIAASALEILRGARGKSILIHCRGGQSRSTAIALLGVADELGAGREEEAVAYIDRIRDICTPNPLVVRLADDLLQRDGALVRAVEAHSGIQARMPAWIEAKIRGILHFHADEPEKAMPMLATLSPERRDAIVADMRAKLLKSAS